MPQVTVYIREQDLEKWKALPKKSEFISNALNSGKNLLMERIDPKALNYDVPARAAVLPLKPMTGVIKGTPTGETVYDLSTMQDRPILKPIKTKEDAVETIKQLFPEAEFIEPLYRDKKKKKL